MSHMNMNKVWRVAFPGQGLFICLACNVNHAIAIDDATHVTNQMLTLQLRRKTCAETCAEINLFVARALKARYFAVLTFLEKCPQLENAQARMRL
jgi:hypothetical protein